MAGSQAREIGMAIALMVEAFRVSKEALTDAKIRILQQAFGKIPTQLIEPAVMHTINTRTPKCKDWLPSNAEILADAEIVRRALLAQHQHEACEDCNHTGWAEVVIDRVTRVERCLCWKRWQAALARLGVVDHPLSLPSPVDATEPERVA